MTIRLLGADEGLTPDEWRELQYAAHRKEYASIVAQIAPRERKNGELASSIAGRLDVLTYRKVTYDVQTVGYADGFEMQTLWGTLIELSRAADTRASANQQAIDAGLAPAPVYTKEQYEEVLAILTRAVTLFARNVRRQEPARGFVAERWYRLREMWRAARDPTWRANPFETASQTEVAELFAFFFACRTRSDVRLHPLTTDPNARSITPRT